MCWNDGEKRAKEDKMMSSFETRWGTSIGPISLIEVRAREKGRAWGYGSGRRLKCEAEEAEKEGGRARQGRGHGAKSGRAKRGRETARGWRQRAIIISDARIVNLRAAASYSVSWAVARFPYGGGKERRRQHAGVRETKN